MLMLELIARAQIDAGRESREINELGRRRLRGKIETSEEELSARWLGCGSANPSRLQRNSNPDGGGARQRLRENTRVDRTETGPAAPAGEESNAQTLAPE
jgi:hypothetical protein